MLESLWNLVTGLWGSLWGLVVSLVCFICDIAVWLHVEAPRLEGLLIGILLAWLFTRRDSHPLLRVASAPLKLVLDILDLAWSQVEEVVEDLWGTAKGWTLGSFNWTTNKIRSAYSVMMEKLKTTKVNLEINHEEDSEK